MGAEPWSYFVPYQENIQSALDQLREQEFQAGRFRGAEDEPESIDEAIENMDADGTGSILDITTVQDNPDFCAVCPLAPARLVELFGSETPDHRVVERCDDLFEEIGRGQGVYVIVFKNGAPEEIYFAGYSFD